MTWKDKVRPGLSTWTSKEIWTERILTFDPSWYLVCMGTGILVQLTALNFPYAAQWLKTIGYIFWIIDICCFAFFTMMSFARMIMFPKVAWGIFGDFQQASFLGAVPIAWETIGTGIIVFYSHVHGAVVVAQVFFWAAVVLSMLVTCGSVYAMYNNQGKHSMNEVTGAWLLVFIPQIVCAAFGSGLANVLGPKNATVIIAISYLMLSLGSGMSFLVLGIYLWRLMSCQLPAREVIVTTFVPVGPTGMSAYAIISLAVDLSRTIENAGFEFHESWETPPTDATRAAVAEMIIWIGVASSLFMLGVAVFFLIEAIVSVITRLPKAFNVGIWSFVFPIGVFTNAWCKLGAELRNDGMKIFGVICVIVTAALWLMCALLTAYKAVWQGKLFYAPGLQGWKEKKEYEELSKNKEQSGSEEESNGLSSSFQRGDTRTLVKRQPDNDGSYTCTTQTSKNGDEKV